MKETVLGCDWGTSSFRLRWVEVDTGQLLHEVRSDEGIAKTFNVWKSGTEDRLTVYRRVLATHIARLAHETGHPLEHIPLIVSGMASSSLGMTELPYACLPFPVDGSGSVVRQVPPTPDFPHEILLISGVRSEQDVMRGEETQLIGLCAVVKDYAMLRGNTTFILPGTHSKHIHVSQGNVTGFQTYMTGELFALLVNHSLLKESVTLQEVLDLSDTDWDSFRQGVRQAAAVNLLHTLFTVRVNQLFRTLEKSDNYFYLSGLLIGTELHNLLTDDQQRLVLCSGSNVYNFYKIALHELGIADRITLIDPETMGKAVVVGQLALFRHQQSVSTLKN